MRYLDLTLPDIADNLALDEALLIAAEDQGAGPILRIWELPSLAVVLGASGRLRDDVQVETCLSEGVAIARRSSGGGTVLIGPGALNVTVVLPNDYAPDLHAVDRAQHYVLERVAQALRLHGPAVEVLGLGDLTIARRKFSGSAQRRLRHHFLIHASILYNFPLPLVSRYTALPKRQPAYREERSHDDFLTNIPLSRDTLVHAIFHAWLPKDSAPEIMPAPYDLIRELRVAKFADTRWIERL